MSLAEFAPDLRVGLVDAGLRRDIPLGETVPPQIKPFLVHLGLWDKFASSGHCPSYRTLSAWGDSRLYANEFLLHPNQIGWPSIARPSIGCLLTPPPRGSRA